MTSYVGKACCRRGLCARTGELQLLMLGLDATYETKPPWFSERRAELERMFPSTGFWSRRSSPEDEQHGRRLCDELLERFRSSSPTTQALDADPAYRARLDAELRTRLISYL